MAVQVKPDQAYAYSELLEILESMDSNYVDKIPKKLMNIFRENSLDTYENHIDASKPLEEQEISPKTSALIGMLTVQYWCETEEEKQELINVFKENERKYQEELKEKYNPDNIFKNNESTPATEDVSNESQVETAQESSTGLQVEQIDVNNNGIIDLPMDYSTFPWYKKIFTKIRNFVFRLFKGSKSQA